MPDPRLIIGLVLLAVCFGILAYIRLFGPRHLTLEHPLKVIVKQDGSIIADEEDVPIGVLISLVRGLQPDDRVVFYYRENPEQDATPKSLEVLNRITPHAPAIIFYDDDQFTIPTRPLLL